MAKVIDVGRIQDKLEKLEEKLRKYCIQNNLENVGSFTVMSNEEEGQNVCYARDMDMGEMGWAKNFYDKKSKDYNFEHADIKWPYTGFVRGVEKQPISIGDLAKWLKGSPYLEKSSALRKNFIEYFEELI